jgi:hypothetical protein
MPEWINGPTVFSFVAAVCAFIAAVWSGVDQNRQLTQIVSAQQQSLDYLTGGDSFIYHHLVSVPNKPPQIRWQNDSTNPAYVVRVSIHNITLGLERTARNVDQPVAGEVVRIDEERFMRPKSSSIFQRFELPKDGNGDFLIWINQRNGEFCQVLGMRRLKGHDEFAYSVYRVPGRDKGIPVLSAKPVKEFRTRGFPQDSDTGKYEWIDHRELWHPVMVELTKAPDAPAANEPDSKVPSL